VHSGDLLRPEFELDMLVTIPPCEDRFELIEFAFDLLDAIVLFEALFDVCEFGLELGVLL
jgi:hypothetical protein